VETNAARMCALLAGLPAINVIGIEDEDGEPLQVHIETTAVLAGCGGCGTRAWLKDQRPMVLTDLAAFGRPTVFGRGPNAVQVADPFHVIKLANTRLDDVRRRVQQDTLDHRGHRDDPLYRSRRLLTRGHERLDEKGEAKLLGFLGAGDPKGEVRMAWHQAQISNGPTEATNSLIKMIKRVGFGFRRFRIYRLRVLLYAGRPNWNLLFTLTPASPVTPP